MSKRVLIVGCGQLGSRHLQAIVQIADIAEIFVFDPHPQALKMGQARVAEVPQANRNLKITWDTELRSDFSSGDLCINAMQAQNRCAMVQRVYEELGYRNFLIEKVVSQSVEEYESLLNFSSTNRLSIRVNCKSRAYGIHQYIKSKLNPEEPIIFSAVAGNHGLANNGVHEADLFVFHDGCREMILTGQRIDQKLHSSKRGGSIHDLTGTLTAVSEKGSECIISFDFGHTAPDTLFLLSASCRFMVDHFTKFALESYAKDNWTWKQVPIHEDWMVSFMTKQFAGDILRTGTCALPTLKDCYPAHKFILNALLPHFHQLLDKELEYCPVT